MILFMVLIALVAIAIAIVPVTVILLTSRGGQAAQEAALARWNAARSSDLRLVPRAQAQADSAGRVAA
jgi:hypothetical protein